MRFHAHTRVLRNCAKGLRRFPLRTIATTNPKQTHPRNNGYYILLPAVPPDTAETNPLLETTGSPHFDTVSEDHGLSGLGKITIAYETAFYQLEEDLQKTKRQRTFDMVFGPLDKLSHSLLHAFSTAKILNLVRRSQKMDDALLQSEKAVSRCLGLPNTSQKLLQAVKEVENEQPGLSEAQKRVISKYLLEARLNGMDLNTKDLRLLQSILENLAQKQEKFRSNLVISARQFSAPILDPLSLEEAPKDVLQVFANDPNDKSRGLSMTLKTPMYNAFMKYCSNRSSRFNTWQGLVNRAGFRNPDLNNSLVIEDIRLMRLKQAKVLGYENYAALSMETKMARSTSNVMAALSEMTIPSKVKCQSELVELQKFAGDNMFPHELQFWDIAYWRRRFVEKQFGIKSDEIRPYFQFPVVLEGLFKLCKDLFQITIKKETSNIPVWHEDVQVYKIFDEDRKELSTFYLDPYARPGLKIAEPGAVFQTSRSDAVGCTPLATLIFSFPPPSGTIPSLLTYDDVNALFQKFGACLQHLLTTVPYGDVSGTNNVEWDALDICGTTLRFFLQKPVILQSLSKHVTTGRPLSTELVERLYKSEKHLASLDLLSAMYFGALDLSLYTRADFWQDITKDVWRDYMPFPMEKHDAHPCGFAHIFIGNYPAAYYSFLWSEMVAADVFAAFDEAGFGNQKEINHVGRRFRDSFLSLGGSCHAAEVFRRFRGRDPSPQSLLRIHDIT